MKAIVTVIGKDQVGITAAVCALLAQHNINILDINQTILQEYFTMVMLVDLSACELSIGEIADLLNYSSTAYFSSQFKSQTGLTPGQFRQLRENRRKPLDQV